MSMFFFLTQFLQDLRGFSALQTGFAFLPMAAGMFAMTRLVPLLLPRFGPRPLALTGAAVMVAGLAWLTRLDADAGYVTAPRSRSSWRSRSPEKVRTGCRRAAVGFVGRVKGAVGPTAPRPTETIMKLSVNMFMTLDGVVQSPGGPDEDPSGGFTRGGWVMPHFGDDWGRVVGGWFDRTEALLFGRFTYQVMAAFWPSVTDPADPVAGRLNTRPKYVVSSTLSDADATWANSTVVRGDFLSAVRDLKEQPGDELQVHGSAQLARALHAAGLVDLYRVVIFPVTVGDGKRLFDPQGPASGFRTVSAETLSTGITALVLEPVPFTAGNAAINDSKVEIHVSEGASA
jgi:dihydrofolate reductase